jgi:hypothetical protein
MASPDRFTMIAIAVMAYAGANVSHEIIGHCGTAALLNSKCALLSTTYIPLAAEIPSWKFRIIAVAGSTANWAVALACLGLLRARPKASPALRYFLWLSLCVNLFIPSTYLMVSPVIMFGDWHNIIFDLPGQLGWRMALAAAGVAACWLSFRLCRAELGKLVGFGGRSAQSAAWPLVVPAYVAGGLVTVAAALLSPLPAKWAQLQAAGGTFGLTFWLLLLPLSVPEPPARAQHPFIARRSIGWIVAGALAALAFVGVLGPGVSLEVH